MATVTNQNIFVPLLNEEHFCTWRRGWPKLCTSTIIWFQRQSGGFISWWKKQHRKSIIAALPKLAMRLHPNSKLRHMAQRLEQRDRKMLLKTSWKSSFNLKYKWSFWKYLLRNKITMLWLPSENENDFSTYEKHIRPIVHISLTLPLDNDRLVS